MGKPASETVCAVALRPCPRPPPRRIYGSVAFVILGALATTVCASFVHHAFAATAFQAPRNSYGTIARAAVRASPRVSDFSASLAARANGVPPSRQFRRGRKRRTHIDAERQCGRRASVAAMTAGSGEESRRSHIGHFPRMHYDGSGDSAVSSPLSRPDRALGESAGSRVQDRSGHGPRESLVMTGTQQRPHLGHFPKIHEDGSLWPSGYGTEGTIDSAEASTVGNEDRRMKPGWTRDDAKDIATKAASSKNITAATPSPGVSVGPAGAGLGSGSSRLTHAEGMLIEEELVRTEETLIEDDPHHMAVAQLQVEHEEVDKVTPAVETVATGANKSSEQHFGRDSNVSEGKDLTRPNGAHGTTAMGVAPTPNIGSSFVGGLPGSQMINTMISAPLVEVALGFLVLLSSLLVAISTVPDLPMWVFRLDQYAEDGIGYIFAAEFMLRWYSAGQLSGWYLTKPLAIIDLVVVMLPLLLSKVVMPLGDSIMTNAHGWDVFSLLATISNSSLINLRLLRILRLQRVLTDMDTFARFQVALGLNPPSEVRPYQLRLARVVLSIFTLLSVSTGLIYTAEHDVNPEIPDYFTALYFGLTTLTTVGFGDITPVTFQGRLVVSATILAGVAFIPAQAASLVEALLDFQKERDNSGGGVGGGGGADRRRQEAEEISAAGQSVASALSCGCGVEQHRSDASFCWSCGAKL